MDLLKHLIWRHDILTEEVEGLTSCTTSLYLVYGLYAHLKSLNCMKLFTKLPLRFYCMSNRCGVLS